jgi:fumarylacetoacetase
LTLGFATAADGRFVVRFGEDIFEVPTHASLDALLAEAQPGWTAVIDELRTLHRDGELTAADPESLALPFTVGDYVDFYSSLEHATNLGRMFRPDSDPLLPNWRAMPVGYHGRSSTVVVSGTGIRRPWGQTPEWSPTRALDIEVELGWVIGGPPNELGEAIPIEQAGERIFGVVLLNDWSARDIQRFEYQPLGPFLGKAFATSISPWVVPVSELLRVSGPRQEPEPAPYLRDGGAWNFDLDIVVELNGEPIAETNSKDLYWSAAQQLAHLASGGAVLRAGDLLGTGTISGVEPDQCGSLIEMGRPFLADGDEVVLRSPLLGEVRGAVLPPSSS